MKTIHGSLLKRVAVLLFIAAFRLGIRGQVVRRSHMHGGVGAEARYSVCSGRNSSALEAAAVPFDLGCF